MKKILLMFSFTIIITLIAFTLFTKESKAILQNQYDYVFLEKINGLDADDYDLYGGFKNCYLTSYPSIETSNPFFSPFQSGFYSLNTYVGSNYLMYYYCLNLNSILNLRVNYINIYLSYLGSFLDDSQSRINYDDVLQIIFELGDDNSLSPIDYYNDGFIISHYNNNIFYNSGSDKYYSDSLKFTFELDNQLWNNNVCYYIGFVLYGIDNPSLYVNYTPALQASFDFSYAIEDNLSSQQNYDLGYSSGYDRGYFVGSQESGTSFYDDGYQAGYSVGYSAGLDNNTWFAAGLISLFDLPIVVFKQIWDFDILGFNISKLIFSLLTFIILIYIVRKFIKRGD